MTTRAGFRAAALMVLAVALASCGPSSSDGGAGTSSLATASPTPIALDPCSPQQLTTMDAGLLTVAAVSPLRSPFFVDEDPSTGEGFEAAVVYAIADRLGFSEPEVVWTTTTGDAAIAPGDKAFDFAIGQIPLTPELEGSVSASSPYYVTDQAEQWVLAFAQGNPLVTCVNVALEELTADGVFSTLRDTWLREGNTRPLEE